MGSIKRETNSSIGDIELNAFPMNLGLGQYQRFDWRLNHSQCSCLVGVGKCHILYFLLKSQNVRLYIRSPER